MKGTFRIGGAVLFGVVIILGAFYVRGGSEQVATGSLVVVAPAPERMAITTKDSDGNGIEDWEENLRERFFETISIPTSTDSGGAGTYEPPTTFTGKFSEAFLQDYLAGKMQGADFSDPTALVANAVTAIDTNTRSRTYIRPNVIRIPTSEESVRDYGNEISSIMGRNPTDGENEAVILNRALSANDSSMLEALVPIKTAYANMVTDALLLPVPTELAEEHLALVNAFEAIHTDIEAMQVAFDDPLYALARMRGYEADATALLNAIVAIAEELERFDITYDVTEPGVSFHLFQK